ncbi:hypothetical protein RQP46_007999 [Phenoliferia psychrophenolica]
MEKHATELIETVDVAPTGGSKGTSDNNTLTDFDGTSESFPREAWGVTAATVAWGAAFACTQVVTAILGPVLARVGDSCGRRGAILLGLSVGAFGMIISATSTNINMTITGSCLFGISYGSAGNIYSAGSEVVPRAHRGTAQVIILLGTFSGVLIGLFAQGALIATNVGGYDGWRASFWIDFILHLIAIALFFAYYRPKAVENPLGLSILQRVLAIDLTGCALLGAGLCPIMVSVRGSGTRFKKDGLFTHALFGNRNFLTALISIAVEGLIYNVFTNFYGVETAVLWEARALPLALRFSPFPFAALVAAPIFGYIVYRNKDAQGVLIAGYCFSLAAVVGMATVELGTNKVVTLYAAFAGAGFASPLVFLNMISQLAVPAHHIGGATALLITARSVGGPVGIASAIYTSKASTIIPAYITAAVVKAGLPATSVSQVIAGFTAGNSTMVLDAVGMTADVHAKGSRALQLGYVDSYRYVWIATVPFIVVAIVILFFLRSTKDAMNGVIDRGVETHPHQKEAKSEA